MTSEIMDVLGNSGSTQLCFVPLGCIHMVWLVLVSHCNVMNALKNFA